MRLHDFIGFYVADPGGNVGRATRHRRRTEVRRPHERQADGRKEPLSGLPAHPSSADA